LSISSERVAVASRLAVAIDKDSGRGRSGDGCLAIRRRRALPVGPLTGPPRPPGSTGILALEARRPSDAFRPDSDDVTEDLGS
jgi:hypothetical protein